MNYRILVIKLCIYEYVLLFSTHIVSADLPAFPNFPTKDDNRVMVAGNSNFYDDITDNRSSAPIEMTHMRVRSRISMHYARTAILCKVYNPNKTPQQANFSLLLPEAAFITGFTMMLGQETYKAYVKEKEEAKEIYNDAVSQGVSTAHIATKARDSSQFIIKFNLEGKTNATYRLRYEEYLVRRHGIYNHAINLYPGMVVPKMDVVVHIKESNTISELRVPEMRTGNEVDAKANNPQNTKAVIRRGKNRREATITFTPDQEEQIRLAEIYAIKSKQARDPDELNIGFDSREDDSEGDGFLGQFVVQYGVDQPRNGQILVNDGYFVHFFAPRDLPPMSKHVVFVLDTSASMWGTKIEQMRSAMDAILSDLRPNDYFNIIQFDSHVRVFNLDDFDRPLSSLSYDENQDDMNISAPFIASPKNIARAKAMISSVHAGGGTNIHIALDLALNLVQNASHHEKRSESTNATGFIDSHNRTKTKNNVLEPIIILLTDGKPTYGEIETEGIIKIWTEKNAGNATLHTLAFGDRANRVFLRQLSLRNDGFMRHIYEAADAALQLHDFYRQVSSPLLSHVKFLYPRHQIKEGSVSRNEFRMINDGSEVIVVGKTTGHVNKITSQVLGLSSDEAGGRRLYDVNPEVEVLRQKRDYLPLERLWAYLTVKQLLDRHDASNGSISDDINYEANDDSGFEDSPINKALNLALKYAFVTPLTSLVVVRLDKTNIHEPVNGESVDEPNFQLNSKSIPPLAAAYNTLSTGTGLSVSTNEGPVLFVQTTRRLTTAGYDTPKISSDQYNGQGSGVPYPIGFGLFGEPKTWYPSVTANCDSNSYANKHHWKCYDWLLPWLTVSKDALMFFNSGTQVTLKISKDINPPKAKGGDATCISNMTIMEPENSLCVYLTRCLVTRYITFDEYKKNHCIIDNGYAGVCCPKDLVDYEY